MKQSDEEYKAKKRLYDIEYRKKNKAELKIKNQIYNESPAGRAMQKRNRDKFKQSHLEYCRTPEYRAWKRDYDQEHVFKKLYGEKEWVRKKKCLLCEQSKPIKEFLYTTLCPGNRFYLCVQCEANHVYEYGIKTSYVVTAIMNNSQKRGQILRREDIYKYPYFIEAYKFNILLKRELK